MTKNIGPIGDFFFPKNTTPILIYWKIAKNTFLKVPPFMFTITTFTFIFNER